MSEEYLHPAETLRLMRTDHFGQNVLHDLEYIFEYEGKQVLAIHTLHTSVLRNNPIHFHERFWAVHGYVVGDCKGRMSEHGLSITDVEPIPEEEKVLITDFLRTVDDICIDFL